jgi:hypothetical protein
MRVAMRCVGVCVVMGGAMAWTPQNAAIHAAGLRPVPAAGGLVGSKMVAARDVRDAAVDDVVKRHVRELQSDEPLREGSHPSAPHFVDGTCYPDAPAAHRAPRAAEAAEATGTDRLAVESMTRALEGAGCRPGDEDPAAVMARVKEMMMGSTTSSALRFAMSEPTKLWTPPAEAPRKKDVDYVYVQPPSNAGAVAEEAQASAETRLGFRSRVREGLAHATQTLSRAFITTKTYPEGSRGARRQALRQAFLSLTPEDRQDFRFQMAELRLQADIDQHGFRSTVDLSATNPELSLSARVAMARRAAYEEEEQRLAAEYRLAESLGLITTVEPAHNAALAVERARVEVAQQYAEPEKKFGRRPSHDACTTCCSPPVSADDERTDMYAYAYNQGLTPPADYAAPDVQALQTPAVRADKNVAVDAYLDRNLAESADELLVSADIDELLGHSDAWLQAEEAKVAEELEAAREEEERAARVAMARAKFDVEWEQRVRQARQEQQERAKFMREHWIEVLAKATRKVLFE